MSIPEISETMKIPIGTVKSRLFQARKIVEKGLGTK
jgi:RNA polymerase sigma-70 factor (ECF subfamily)